jgi:hypothetical protein
MLVLTNMRRGSSSPGRRRRRNQTIRQRTTYSARAIVTAFNQMGRVGTAAPVYRPRRCRRRGVEEKAGGAVTTTRCSGTRWRSICGQTFAEFLRRKGGSRCAQCRLGMPRNSTRQCKIVFLLNNPP